MQQYEGYLLVNWSAEHIQEQSGAVEACWAHNPEVRGSKPRSARTTFFYIFFSIGKWRSNNFYIKSLPPDAVRVYENRCHGLQKLFQYMRSLLLTLWKSSISPNPIPQIHHPNPIIKQGLFCCTCDWQAQWSLKKTLVQNVSKGEI